MQHSNKTGNPEILVWRVDLNVPNETYQLCKQSIGKDERARADRFKYERDRRRFIVSHAALRVVLAHALGIGPLEIRFREGPRGRPLLAGTETHPPPQFSLSHSDDSCLIGLAHKGRIGVDIEKRRPEVDCRSIADRFFTTHEADMVRNADEEVGSKLFFGLWTRKEAYLKATGLGLHGSLTALECTANDDGSLQVSAVEGSDAASRYWTVLDLDDNGFAACAMIEGIDRPYQLREFVWHESELHGVNEYE